MDRLEFATASELATAIRQGLVSSTEVLDSYLAQIAKHNPALNAIVTLDEDRARRRAREADSALRRGEWWGSLHGVPFTLKEFHTVKGVRNASGGQRDIADFIPDVDSTVAVRLKKAGAIFLGMTNLEFDENNMYGHTRNPWDLERTPGTSSSGAAAAIAAGLSTLDIGSDGGGSILVPSHYCGIYGMRPTESRVSMYGLNYFPEPAPIFREGFVLGPMARSVEDLRMALQVISGPDRLDPRVPPMPWQEVFRPEFGSLRIAWTPDFPGTKISTEIRYAIEGLIQELARRGAQIEQCLPEVDFWEQDRLFSQLSELIFSAFPRQEEEKQPAKLGDYFIVLNHRDAIIAQWEQFMEEWDVLICPVAQSTAPRLTDTSLLVDGEPLPDNQKLSPCTSFCLTALPSVVVPLSLDAQKIPMGVLLVGKRWSDQKLLAIAALVSEITGGFRRPPGF